MANIIISIVLIGIVTGIVLKMVKDKKVGKSSCGCGCQNCAMNSECHKMK